MAFRKKRKRKLDVEDVDITSLLDILVILLVFLLNSYNSSELTIEIIENIALPYSLESRLGKAGPIIQVNNDRFVWVAGQKLGILESEGTKDSSLISALKNIQNQRINDGYKPKKDEPENINLIFDKKLDYSDIQIVMRSCTEAGFGEFNFIVTGR